MKEYRLIEIAFSVCTYYLRTFGGNIKRLLLREPFKPFTNQNTINLIKLFFRHTKIISSIYFEVCSSCNRRCRYCLHSDMMTTYKGFELSLEELSNFLDITRKSNYYIERIDIHGPGEPLLWTHLNEGIKMIYDSKLIGKINIWTNGKFLKKIKPEILKYINIIVISVYPDEDILKILENFPKQYLYKIQKNIVTEFITYSDKDKLATIPCKCFCHGPMFIKDKIFLYCGPLVFGAIKVKGDNIFDHKYLFRNIDIRYMDAFEKLKIGNLELCKYCMGNENNNVSTSFVTQISEPLSCEPKH